MPDAPETSSTKHRNCYRKNSFSVATLFGEVSKPKIRFQGILTSKYHPNLGTSRIGCVIGKNPSETTRQWPVDPIVAVYSFKTLVSGGISG